ncbi:NupC/NupG family nucleoside CNT transporter [Bradyrhizobium sp.]|uniref:NupC/NupG family nucleoside CNT transporter n=1 Tax=Bradyrhizobium sp. TaxID=376 RepID=UPI002734E746|nr:nucleoside transporter C-terminal domain-containing protein [Bradyrhizobium sp.]MDP3689595.1 nucleoside transporter C-terminal domain-containing protein [Bradyrhizobium sp.]
MLQLQSAFGVFALLAIAWALSENRRAVSPRQAAIGLAVTFLTALALTKLPFVAHAFGAINDAIGTVSPASRAGSSFVFGYLGGGALPFDLKAPGADFILAFQALPVVLVMSVLTTLLFYWKILPPVVRGMSWLLERTLGVGGAVGLSTAANIFLGMVEAPLFIRPYLARLTRSELFLVMTGGMAGIAGTVLVLYATLLAPLIPDSAAHFVIASVLGAPAAILISLIMVPQTSHARTAGVLADPRGDPRVAFIDAKVAEADPDIHASSTMDAIVKGTTAGLELLLNIVAMLLVLVALVYLANAALGLLPPVGGAAISMQRMLGYVMAPVCWLMGLPWPQAVTAGSLMGVKTVLNELIAYVDLSRLGPEALDPRSRLIMLYAMCGFANFGSLGIMIGGLGTMAPQRRDEINALGLKSIVSGTLTTCLMGAIIGVLN